MNLGVVDLGVFDRRIPRPVPGLDLAKDVVLLAAQVAEPDLVGVERMQRCQGVDPRLSHGLAVWFGNVGLDILGVVHRVALDQTHHVEVSASDVGGLAERERLGHWHRCRPERRDTRPLTAHVMRLGQEFTHRRTTDNRRTTTVRRVDAIGQVRMAALEFGPHKRWLERLDMFINPGFDFGHVVANDLCIFARNLVSGNHVGQPPIDPKVLPSAASFSSKGEIFQ